VLCARCGRGMKRGDRYCPRCGHPAPGDAGAGHRLTPSTGELVVRRVSGSVLLLLTLGPLALWRVSFGLLAVPLGLAMSIYLWRSRTYRPGTDVFWVVLGFPVYACSLPFLGPAPTALKLILLPADWSNWFPPAFLSFALAKLMLLACAIFLLVGDILGRSRVGPARRGLLGAVTLLLALGMLSGLPLLRPVGPQLGPATGVGTGGAPPWSMAFNMAPRDGWASFDTGTGSWV